MNKLTKHAAILISMVFAVAALPSTAQASGVYIGVPGVVVKVIGNSYHKNQYSKSRYNSKKYYNKRSFRNNSYSNNNYNSYSNNYNKSRVLKSNSRYYINKRNY